MSFMVESNKAKIAKRVIEVLEYFDEEHPEATVMDIVRRYKRPQSSTSDLLLSLVDLGLLYKNPLSRTYTLTPRAAMLGASSQPGIVRDGRLTSLIDRLAAQTGLSVGVFGMVGLSAQIFTWRSSSRTVSKASPLEFWGGKQDRLSDSAAGWLLLSTIPQPRRDAMLRRLIAEAPAGKRLSFAELSAHIEDCREKRVAVGPAGFDSSAHACAALLPEQPDHHPMVVGLAHQPSEQLSPAALIRCIGDGVRHCLEQTPAATERSLYSVA